MTLDDLRAFVATCETGSLSAAARQFGTSQSAVSQHIRRLEREVGVALFERSRRGVTPTAAGRVLRAAASEALGAIEAGRRELVRMRDGEAGTLRVVTGGATLRHFMTRPLAEFRRRYPGVTFEYVSATSTRQCLDTLRSDGADLAFVTMGDPHGLDQRPAVRTPWLLVVPAADPLAGRRSVRCRDLRDVRPIGMPPTSTSRQQLEDQFGAHGIRLAFAATVDDWDTAIRLVELGVGHAIVPGLWVHDVGDGLVRAVPIDDLAPVAFGWAARRWDALSPDAAAFVELVGEGFGRLGPPARAEPVG